MKGMSRSRHAQHPGALTGPLRIGGDPRTLAGKVRKGDIVLVDRVDLDAATAEMLAERAPAAVINASPSMTGRFEARGATRLALRGIPLFDAADRRLLAASDGVTATISTDHATGIASITAGAFVSAAQAVGEDHIARRLEESASTGALRLPTLAASALDLVQRDGPQLVDGAHVPELDIDLRGRDVLVVAAGAGYKEQLRSLARPAKELKVAVIATGEAADAAAAVRRIDVVVGPFDAASDAVLARAGAVVVHGESHAVAATRLGALGVRYATSESRLDSGDLAIAIAASAGARTIIAVGSETTLPDLVDSPKGASTLLARMAAGPAWVDARTFSRLYRSRVSRLLTWGWLLLACAAVAGAAALQPAVHDAVSRWLGR